MGVAKGESWDFLIDQVRSYSRVDQGRSKWCGEEWSEWDILKVELMDFLILCNWSCSFQRWGELWGGQVWGREGVRCGHVDVEMRRSI